MTPRDFFPNMPDELYKMWIEPFVTQIGWPFTSLSDDITNTRWKYLFGGISLDEWHSASWKLIHIDISSTPINSICRSMIDEIIKNCTAGLQTLTTNLEDTQQRFSSCVEFIAANKKIPAPSVVLVRDGKLEIMDGSHRIAALLYAKVTKDYWVPAWAPYQHLVLTGAGQPMGVRASAGFMIWIR